MIIQKPQKTHSFIPVTVAKSSEVNTNFDNVFDMYDTTGYLFDGWFPLAGASLEYHATDAVKTTTDVNLTDDIQVGDRVTFENPGEKFFTVQNINYNSTVANRTYIQLTGATVANSAITTNTVGFSRHIRPYKFPAVPFFGNETSGLINGKIVPSVNSNNLTVAIKTYGDTDPSTSNPVGIYIGGGLRWITSALSVTANAGTNWFNSGSAELATQAIDYFVYLGFNATDGVTIGFSRIPYVNIYSQFNTTNTNEKYARISTITNAAAGDNYVNIGRFAATLSTGAGFTWTVPTYTADNLIQRPIYETRYLTFNTVTSSGGAMTYSSVTSIKEYKIDKNIAYYNIRETGTTGGTASLELRFNLPLINNKATNQIAIGTSWQGGINGRAELVLSPTNRTVLLYRGSDAGVINWGIGANNGLLNSNFWYFID